MKILSAILALALVLVSGIAFSLYSQQQKTSDANKSLNERVASMMVENAQLSSQVKVLTAQVSQLAPEAARARKMPVSVSLRKAMTGAGDVIQFHNTETKSIRLAVHISNGNLSKDFSFVLDRLGVKEIGHLEGWAASAGDTVLISAQDYDNESFTLN